MHPPHLAPQPSTERALPWPTQGVEPGSPTHPRQGAVGQFQLLRLLGRGGMGEVYEAEDLLLGRRVALKLIRPAGGAEQRPRLLHEAQAAVPLAQDLPFDLLRLLERNPWH